MKTIATLALLAMLIATPAAADTYGVEVTGGYGSYAMDQANTFIDDLNQDAGTDVLENLEGGANYGLALSRRWTPRVSASVAYERLVARTQASDESASLDLKAPGNVFKFSLAYHLIEAGWFQPFVQGGAGFLTSSGYLEWRDGSAQRKHEFSGNTLQLDAGLGALMEISHRIAATVTVGYRFGEIKELQYDGSSFGGYGKFNGPGVDYSGWTVKAGIRIRLNWGTDDEDQPKPPIENHNQM